MTRGRKIAIAVSAIPAVALAVTAIGRIGGVGTYVLALPGYVVVSDVAGHFYWNAIHVAAMLIVSWLFWLCCIWVFIFAAFRRRVASAGLLLGLIIAVLLSFRSTCIDMPSGEACFHRSWGVITRVTTDSDSDGRIDYEGWYSWMDPFIDPHVGELLRMRIDMNYDGSWDTWADYAENTLQIDTNLDSTPDVLLTPDREGFEEAKTLRGF